MIHRDEHLDLLQGLLKRHRVVGILGARQVGKTTLAKCLAARVKQSVTYFDLENPADQARLAEPLLALESLRGLVVIDEIQRSPHLFEVLRVLVDRPRPARRFLVLGSASPDLLRQNSETLAGRIVYHELTGFTLGEIGAANYRRLWLRGGFPRAYLARSNMASFEWREAFVRTFLERDLPGLGIAIAAPTLRRFWTMLAHYHGQTWNASEFGRSFGVADTTVRHYLDLLTGALVVRQLQPWHENLSKRQVKSPKVYIKDSGLLHGLLGLATFAELESHPKVGASWEGFAIEQVIHQLRVPDTACHFWATHAGAELDLLVVRGSTRLGFEVKHTLAPKVTPSMRTALADLRLTRLDVIHAGQETFPLSKQIRAVALSRLLNDVAPLGYGHPGHQTLQRRRRP
jgi:predicted AAA+ superfamily ATPase